MPRTTSLVCSGICLLFTTALPGQVLPKHPTPQQIAAYRLHQQREGHLRQLPAHSVWFKSVPGHPTRRSAFSHRLAHELPVYNTPYGFSIKQSYGLYPNRQAALTQDNPSELLDLYMARNKIFSTNWPTENTWTDPGNNIGSLLLRSFIESRRAAPPGSYKSRKQP